MPGDYDITYRGTPLRIPSESIDKTLMGHSESATFSSIREMFAQDSYLRAFKGQTANTVIDLGSNRGFFMLIANKVLKAQRAIGVEPESRYQAAFDLICEHNHIDPERVYRYQAFIGDEADENMVTMPMIFTEQGLTTVDFLKCDIEGGEFVIMTPQAGWMKQVNNIAMEVHPSKGNVPALIKTLEQHGFTVIVADQFGRPMDSPPPKVHYIYASRTDFRLGSA
jgi:hypothetical protein